jgi:hypothetical protein
VSFYTLFSLVMYVVRSCHLLNTHTLSHTHTHTHNHTITLSHYHTHTITHYHTLSHTITHTHTHSKKKDAFLQLGYIIQHPFKDNDVALRDRKILNSNTVLKFPEETFSKKCKMFLQSVCSLLTPLKEL